MTLPTYWVYWVRNHPSHHGIFWDGKIDQTSWGCVKKPEPFQMGFPDAIFLFPIIVFLSVGFTPWSKNSHERGKGKGKGIVKEGKGKNRKGRGKGKERERKRKGKGKRKQKEKERKTKGKGTEKETKKERKKDRKKERRRKRKSKGRDRKKDRKGRGKGEEKGKKQKEKQGSVSHGQFLMPKVIVFVIVRESCVCVFLFFWKRLQSSKKECSDHLPGTFLVQNLRHYDNKQWKEETKSTK